MTISVSVIGAGIGSAHLGGYAQLTDRYRVHSVCDVDEARGRPLAEKHGAEFVTDLQVILSNPDVDLVDICLPPHLHLTACLQALDAGKKVICEKPLVSSLAEVDQLTNKVAETKGFLSPVFQYRFGLGTAQLRALIEAGLAGRPFAGTLETHWDRPASYYDVDWRGTWKGEQGGAVLGHAIHIHDLLSSMLGPVSSVFAGLATRVNDIEVEDCAALTIQMQNGALVTSSVTLGAAENTSRLRLAFEGFTVESDHAPYSPAEKGWRFIARAPTSQQEIDDVLAGVGSAKTGYAGMFEAVAEAVAGRESAYVTLEDGRRSIEFVTAVYSSARTRQVVALPLTADHPLYDGWLP